MRRPPVVESSSSRTVEEEIARFHQAQQRTVTHLESLYHQAVPTFGCHAASIFSIHAMLLQDSSFSSQIEDIIQDQHTTAEYAVQATSETISQAFADMDSHYMQARGADIRDISNQVIGHLLHARPPVPLSGKPAILALDELLPSEMLSISPTQLLGVICWNGSADSHTAMLLRHLEIPALAQTPLSCRWDGYPALLDGTGGQVYIEPDEALLGYHGFPSPRMASPASLLCSV